MLSQEITPIPEPELGASYLVTIRDGDEIVETLTTDDRFADFLPPEESFEDRHAPFGPEWQAEREKAAI